MKAVMKPLLGLGLAAAALPALSTTGYFAHGYGLKAKGMGGTGIALSHDSFGGANNPAGMANAGHRLDLGFDLFHPEREARRDGAGFPTLNGAVRSGRENFLVPEFGYNRMVRPDLAVGVSVFGNGGMNTAYPQSNFNCGGGPANILCGSGTVGVDLMQLIVAPTVAYKPSQDHAFGVSLLLGHQRFKATGLQAFDNAPGFPPFTGAPGRVTDRGRDSASGVGVRVGWQGKVADGLVLGATYASKINMGRFDKYAGLFAGAGDFDIPANFGAGLAWSPTPRVTFAADVQKILYSEVASVGAPSMPVAPLGAPNGPGFGWRDVTVVKVGLAYQVRPSLVVRGGFSRGTNPVQPQDVTFNILAPGVVRDHITLGFTQSLGAGDELTGSLMVAPRQSTTGPSLFNAVMGPGAGGTETVSMRQWSVGVAWARRF